MLEIPAAHIIKATTREITIALPAVYEDAWAVLARATAVQKSRQVYVKLDKPRKPRTTGYRSQNKHVNGHVMQIARHTGDSFDDVKMHIKREALAAGYPSHTDSFGNVVPQSEAYCDTREAGILIETAHRVASFLGVALKEYDDEESGE